MKRPIVNKNIEHYIFHKENFLDEKYCENCIDELDRSTWKKHLWYSPRTDSNWDQSGDKEPDILLVDPKNENITKINDFIIQNLHSVILEYVKSLKFDWYDEWTGFSAIRFNRYLPG